MNKAIAIINPSGLGGAEKRYITLFNYLQQQDSDIFLIINKGLLRLAQEKGLLLDSRNKLILELSYDVICDSRLGTRNSELGIRDFRKGEKEKRRRGDFTKTRKHEGTKTRLHEDMTERKLDYLKTGLCDKVTSRLHNFTKKRGNNSTIQSPITNHQSLLQSSPIQNYLGRYSSFVRSWIRWNEFERKIVPLIKVNGIDTIYTVWLGGVWLAPLKKKLNLKLIHSFNDSGFSSISSSILNYYKSEYNIIKKADKIDCLSNRLRSGLITRIKDLDDKKFVVSPCSFIDYKNLYPEKKENWIVFCGRLEKIKNPLLLLRTVDQIREHIMDRWKVIFLGNGSLLNEMREYIVKKDLNFVEIVGYTANPKIYLRKSKIFVSLQQEDNYPSQSLMEAMACENAIIASNTGDTGSLIDDNSGILVKLDVNDIKEKLLYLMKDENLISRKGKNARMKVTNTHTIERYLDYFKGLINE